MDLAKHWLRLGRAIASATGGNWPKQCRLYCRVRGPSGVVGYGEAAPHPVYGPRVEALEGQIRRVATTVSLSEIWKRIRAQTQSRDCETAPLPPTLLMAVLDALARSSSMPLWHFLNWPAPPTGGHRTMITYGGTDPFKVCEQIEAETPPAIKLKCLGRETDLTVLREVIRSFSCPVAVDVNAAWSQKQAIKNLRAMEAWGSNLLWVEQPCKPESMTKRLPTSLPIFADEAVHHPAFRWEAYDGVILKPAAKGLLDCATIATMAARRGKEVSLGCHLQSSLLTNATLNLGGFVSCSWVDLDTTLLLLNDPFGPASVSIKTGKLGLPDGTGLASVPGTDLDWVPLPVT